MHTKQNTLCSAWPFGTPRNRSYFITYLSLQPHMIQWLSQQQHWVTTSRRVIFLPPFSSMVIQRLHCPIPCIHDYACWDCCIFGFRLSPVFQQGCYWVCIWNSNQALGNSLDEAPVSLWPPRTSHWGISLEHPLTQFMHWTRSGQLVWCHKPWIGADPATGLGNPSQNR